MGPTTGPWGSPRLTAAMNMIEIELKLPQYYYLLASLSAGNNTGVVLVPCSWWKCIPTTAISGGVNISEVPGCHLLQQMRAQCGWQKLPQGLLPHELTAYLSIFALFKLN